MDNFDARVKIAAEQIKKWLPEIKQPDVVIETAASNILLQSDHAGRPTLASVDVMIERTRQVAEEGWTPEHDDQHDPGDLSGAGAAYALNAACLLNPFNGTPIDEPPESWMFEREWWKPQTDPAKARRDLVKAGALIIAEIERLDRAGANR